MTNNEPTKDEIYKKASSLIRNQRRRCKDPKRPQYPWYGAKGVRVEYTYYELAAWLVRQIGRKRSLKLCDIVIGRINHSKNYSLDNIEITTRSANVRERNERCGFPSLRQSNFS